MGGGGEWMTVPRYSGLWCGYWLSEWLYLDILDSDGRDVSLDRKLKDYSLNFWSLMEGRGYWLSEWLYLTILDSDEGIDWLYLDILDSDGGIDWLYLDILDSDGRDNTPEADSLTG
jgi:hypothetical protein